MAGNQGAIDDVVRESALKQLDDLTAKATAAEAQIVSLTKAATELNAATGNSRSFREYNNNAARAATETAKLQKAQQDLARATVLLQQAEQRLAAATNQTAISQERLTRESLRTQQAIDKAAASAAKAKSPYEQLVQVHRDLVAEARNAGVQFGMNSRQYIEASNQANGVGNRLNAINNNLGNYSNNVGNYTRGIADYFTKFYSGIRIAANIIPGLGISGIFLLAYEGIKAVVQQLDILNFNLTEAELKANSFKEAFKSATFKESVSSVIELQSEIKQSRQGFIDSEIVVKKYNETIGQTVGKVSTLDEVEKALTANSKDYIKSMFFKAAAAAALSQGTDDLVKATQKLQTAEANATLTANDLSQIRAEIAKGGDNAKMYEGLLKMAENADKVDKKSVKSAQKNQDEIVSTTTSTYDKLIQLANNFAKNFTSASSQDITQRKINEFLDDQIRQYQITKDKNDSISQNDKKSYADRKAALKMSLDDEIKIIKVQRDKETDVIGLQQDQKDDIISKSNYEIIKATVEYNKKLNDLNSAAAKDRISYQQEVYQTAKKNEQAIISDQTKSLDERLKAINDYERDATNSAKLAAKVQRQDAGDNADKIKTINVQLAGQLADIQKEVNDKKSQLNKDAQAAIIKLFKDGEKQQKEILDNSLDVATQYTNQLKQDSQDSASDQLQILADQYAKGEILAKDYQARKKEIENIAKVNQDDIDIAGLQLQYSIRIKLGEDTADVERKLADAKRKRDKDATDNAIDNAEREYSKQAEIAERKKKLQDAIVKDADAAADLIKTIVDAGFQNQLNKVQDEKDALSDRTKAEIDAENRSTDSAQTKADKIAIINAKAQAQQDQLDQKARAIKKKQAEADRLFSIAKIIETTALAVISALAPPPLGLGPVLGIPFAIAAGALGAVQLATVLATPIPAYEKGTDNAKGGLSLVGEAGKEYVLPPGGDGFFTPDSATLMDIPAGSKVIPHNELFQIMANPFSNKFEKSDRSDRRMIEAINRGNNQLVRAVKANKPRKPVISGWATEMGKANNFANYRNNHFR